MSATLHILGVRHHGPGSARMVAGALRRLRPDAVLIEGPPDAADVLPLASHQDMKPPVALLVYEPDDPKNSVYYPFAEFSPEWQAIRWGLGAGVPVRFIDLPQSLTPRHDEPRADPDDAGNAAQNTSDHDDQTDDDHDDEAPDTVWTDPLDQLAAIAGMSDGEAWWGRLIEERRGDEDPTGVFDAIRQAMGDLRTDRDARRNALGSFPLRPADRDEPAREAHMRTCIRAAIKEGFERIAVVCGAWHAPVLTGEAIKQHAPKGDAELLKGLAKRKTTATWIPWTNERLAMFSGYGAGVHSPGWYEHLWMHREHLSERWLTRVARLMRDERLDASPASVIESVRLADALAALRGRAIASLEELGEATLSILCHGNPLPMRVIERTLIIGQRLGHVPEEAPTVPLQRDLSAQQKSLRMKVTADDQLLDLDQRKPTDLARSRLLHRLNILRIDWGELQTDQRRVTGTFHEVWKLQWKPDFSVAVIEAARWGSTVEEAASAFVRDRAANAAQLDELTGLLESVLLADLPGVLEELVGRIQAVSAVGAEMGHLMDALPPLARVLRYGNVRKTDSALVEPVVLGLLARIRAGLLPACGSLDDAAASAMRSRIDNVHASLAALDRPDIILDWKQQLAKVGDADVHGLVAGRCWRLLLDSGDASPDDAATRLGLGLSRGNDPEKSSAWLEGFLSGSGMVLVHDDRLLGIVDRWVSSLTRETFEHVCPIVRRTFASFEPPERRNIGEKLRNASGLAPDSSGSGAAGAEDYEPARGSLVDPVLRLILGDRFT